MDRFLGMDESYLLTPLSKSHIVGGLVISGLTITTLIAVFIFICQHADYRHPFSRAVHQWASIFIVIILTTLCLLSLMFVILEGWATPGSLAS